MMIADVDELSYDREEDGVLVRKQLERVVLARGAWATVLFLFQELDRETGAYRAPKMAIVRFQKWRGGYRTHSSFGVANEAQARELMAVFERWSPRMAIGADVEETDVGHDGRDDLGAEA
jgi:hypothetical protein